MQIIEKPYWIDTINQPILEKLKGDKKCDVLIVGAGITGITLAMLLSQNGINTIVLEASKVCSGTSGKTTAKITFQHGLKLYKLSNSHSLEIAGKYIKANQIGLMQIADFIKEYNIECDFVSLPSYVYTQTSDGIKDLENELKVMQRLGTKGEITAKINLPFDIISALKIENQAQFNPVKYVNALARVISQNENCTIYENSMAVDIKKGNTCKVYTANGMVETDTLVLATNFPIIDIPGLFFAKLHQQKSYIIATPANELDVKGMYINDVDPVNSIRMHYEKDKNMLLAGGFGHKAGQKQPNNSYQSLLSFVRDNLTSNMPYIYQWGAQDCMTLDDMPYVGRLSTVTPNIYIATGYAKWGMTNSTAAALMIANEIVGGSEEISNLQSAFSPQRFTVKASAKNFVVNAVDVAKQIVDGIAVPRFELSNIVNGDGMVIKIKGEKMAVYRDENSNISAFSPYCTHLGCVVEFNDTDKTWDCPCHGSRYDTMGNVIEGPAKKSLKPIDFEGIDESQIITD